MQTGDDILSLTMNKNAFSKGWEGYMIMHKTDTLPPSEKTEQQ